MSWIDRIAHSFTMGFGITQPAPGQQRRAGIFIVCLLLAILALFAGLAFFLFRHFLA